ncbi:MAG: EamA family transporter RarD [Acidimicrobiia bacterium]|nr:EamA family transporter RarD [Acidimicrobiia bacterium]
MNRGIAFGVGAYLVWGVLPVFWKAIESVGAFEILAHRFVWSVVFLAGIVTLRRSWPQIRGLDRNSVARLLFAGLLLGVNWVTYIWAVTNGHIVESSLGYFINPLLNVLLGVVILRERLEPGQWLAVAIAACGVAYMTVRVGSLPWIALVLAGTFGFYALLKKQVDAVGPIESLTVEVSLLVLPALLFLLALGADGSGSFGAAGARITVLLALTGVATATPLLLFGAAARRIKLATIGILQYIAPSLQFLIGVFVYSEAVSRDELIGFLLVWIALAVFTGHGLLRSRYGRPEPVTV